ncbi:type II toxin-antitoxin system mRNA interferase toxin, RelE/StbE family [archaeon]|nr:type II toxin-antitoxin system mRNA interferase toxin, RelE/StbE family [archaeon]|tara:strand:- start:5143 stop:5403 length:261 start_codon:yes stop_codon:yes gene_type:complete
MYSFDTKPNIDKIFLKLQKKNPKQLPIIFKKIEQICENPYHFKPLRGDMKGSRRVHIDKSFVLVYEINEEKKIIEILDYDYHDKIY